MCRLLAEPIEPGRSEGVGEAEELVVDAWVGVADGPVREVVNCVVEGPGVGGALRKLEAGPESEGKVEGRGIVRRDITRRNQETGVEKGVRLKPMSGTKIEALTQGAEAAGIRPARAAGSGLRYGRDAGADWEGV